ncbi:exonuclease domain-containing protein [Phthorimaea operculella]|nr:exonuclease domain-containing protein [Phthorimaea operculella]
MPAAASFVFFDIETTGLPLQEKNQTKIIEYSFVAVLRKDVEATPYGQIPPIVNKISSVLNPEKPIGRVVTQMTGLSRKKLSKAPTFKEKLQSITSFLTELPAPVCLVAHNGNTFDFRILLAECNDISASLPANLYCLDSLPGFRSILMGTGINYTNLGGQFNAPTSNIVEQPQKEFNAKQTSPIIEQQNVIEDNKPNDIEENKELEDLMLDSIIVEGQDMVVSAEEEVICEVIDEENQEPLQLTMNNIKRSLETPENPSKKKCLNEKENAERECFKLVSVYKRLLNKDGTNAHRAENDCLMLLECVVAIKDRFLPWADKNTQLLSKIRPLSRNWWRGYNRNKYYRR